MDYAELKSKIVAWIRNWFDRNGSDCNAVVGISGGKDSTVVAALCKEALGSDRVVGVLMPNGEQPDLRDAIEVCQLLGIRFFTVNISEAYEGIEGNVLGCGFDGEGKLLPSKRFELSKQALTNLAPRLRMSALYAVSQSVHGRVANTSNLSERWIGWSTRYGDSVGDFSPLYNLTTDEVIRVGLACGLPSALLMKPPADGLTGRTDEENFGFTYAQLNDYICTGQCEPDVAEAIDRRHKTNMFKSKPMETFEAAYIKRAI